MNIKKVNAGVWVKALDDIFPTESGVITMRTYNMGVWTQYINIGQVDKEYWKKTKFEWLKPVEGYVLSEKELKDFYRSALVEGSFVSQQTFEQFLQSINQQ